MSYIDFLKQAAETYTDQFGQYETYDNAYDYAYTTKKREQAAFIRAQNEYIENYKKNNPEKFAPQPSGIDTQEAVGNVLSDMNKAPSMRMIDSTAAPGTNAPKEPEQEKAEIPEIPKMQTTPAPKSPAVNIQEPAKKLAGLQRGNKPMSYMDFVKKASPITEYAGDVIYSNLPYVSPAAFGGAFTGMLSSPATENSERAWDESDLKSLIPGVGSYRLQRRIKRQMKDDKGGTAHLWSAKLGGIPAALLATGVGALGGGIIGAATNNFANDDRPALAGATIGAGIGAGAAGVAELVAMIAAAARKRRTKEEQKAYANTGTAKEWLVPGVGTYNYFKSIGRAIGDAEEREDAEYAKTHKAASLQKKAVTLENVKNPNELVVPYMTDEGKFSPHRTAQSLGPLTNMIPSIILGAGLGYGIGHLTGNSSEAGNFAAMGGLLGVQASALADIGGIVAGFLAKRRTAQEENEYLKSPTAADYLIPGMATYNAAQTYRVNQNEIENLVAKAYKKNTRAVAK